MSELMPWEITNHVCRRCLGRLLKSGLTVRCADCGATVKGAIDQLCACGVKTANGADAGMRCQPNPERKVIQQEIVVRWLGAQRKQEKVVKC